MNWSLESGWLLYVHVRVHLRVCVCVRACASMYVYNMCFYLLQESDALVDELKEQVCTYIRYN